MSSNVQGVPVLMNMKEVEIRTGLKRSTIYRFISENEFPIPIKISKRLVRWLEADVIKWIEKKISQTRSNN